MSIAAHPPIAAKSNCIGRIPLLCPPIFGEASKIIVFPSSLLASKLKSESSLFKLIRIK